MFYDLEMTGAGHGIIGIVTQLVVATPSLAPRLKTKLRAVLDLRLAQKYCVCLRQQSIPNAVVLFSLKALRPYFPDMQG